MNRIVISLIILQASFLAIASSNPCKAKQIVSAIKNRNFNTAHTIIQKEGLQTCDKNGNNPLHLSRQTMSHLIILQSLNPDSFTQAAQAKNKNNKAPVDYHFRDKKQQAKNFMTDPTTAVYTMNTRSHNLLKTFQKWANKNKINTPIINKLFQKNEQAKKERKAANKKRKAAEQIEEKRKKAKTHLQQFIDTLKDNPFYFLDEPEVLRLSIQQADELKYTKAKEMLTAIFNMTTSTNVIDYEDNIRKIIASYSKAPDE